MDGPQKAARESAMSFTYLQPVVLGERNVASPFWLFVLRYVFWVLVLFGSVYLESISPLFIISQLQTELSVLLTTQWVDFFDIPIVMRNNTLLFEHGLTLQIVNGCNALAPMLLFAAAALAYPTHLRVALRWCVLAYAVLLLANTVRLCGISFYVIQHPDSFAFMHNVVGRFAMAALPLMLFCMYLHWVPVAARHDH